MVSWIWKVANETQIPVSHQTERQRGVTGLPGQCMARIVVPFRLRIPALPTSRRIAQRLTITSLSAFNGAIPEEQAQLLSPARQILANLGKKDATAITIDDTAWTPQDFRSNRVQWRWDHSRRLGGDERRGERRSSAMSSLAWVRTPIRSGKPGVSQVRVDHLFSEARAFSDWWKKAESDASAVFPLGDDTLAAYACDEDGKSQNRRLLCAMPSGRLLMRAPSRR